MNKILRCLSQIMLTSAALLCLSGCGETAPEKTASPLIDLNGIYSLSNADQKTVHDNAQNIQMEENGVYRIEAGGAYRLTGNHSGQIFIDAQDELVHLILDNTTLQSYHGPAIFAESAAKLIITLPEGTENAVSDSAYYEGFSSAEACIFSNCDLTVNGSGTLEVSGYFEDSVRSKDIIKVLNSNLLIRSKSNGLRAADGIVLESANADLQCEANGIYTTKSRKPGRGFVSISGGSISVTAGEVAVKVSENLYLKDCQAYLHGVFNDISCDGKSYIQEGCLQ